MKGWKTCYGEERIDAFNIQRWVYKFKVEETSAKNKEMWNTSDRCNRKTMNYLIRTDCLITVAVMFLELSFGSNDVQTMNKNWCTERYVQKSSQLTADLK